MEMRLFFCPETLAKNMEMYCMNNVHLEMKQDAWIWPLQKYRLFNISKVIYLPDALFNTHLDLY